MTPRSERVPPTGLPTLAMLLRRGQLRVATVTLLVVGSVLTLGMLLSLRLSQLHSLELIARSIAYSGEAAVVFRDAAAAEELLAEVVARERLAGARIVLAGGAELAGREGRPRHALLAGWTERLLPLQARAEVRYQGRVLGYVELHGDDALLMRALAWALAAVLLGMALSGLAVLRGTQRLTALLETPLRELAAQSRAIRQQRAFDRRAQGGAVQEIAALAADFNALLDEVQAREAELLRRHAALQTDHENLSHRARRDGLTGVANRAHFEQCLREAVERARTEGGGLGLLFIDADRFKQINDEYGHEVGDRVLVALAQRLRGAVREHDLVARLGGDEFVVLIEPLRHAEDAWRVVQQIEQAVVAPVALGPGGSVDGVTPGISVGVAVYPEHGDSAEALLRAADGAMYRRKRRDRAAPQS
ncbi:diguanylate cyclase [Roseateles sp. DAIF2]|uniref:sensor domain-containing diguanylate cyclase n=1 Tax=Roseateles sp. DAIF2 TaxID=2714952 RepID=UPI0018A322B5|nr:sensor domain-containing diguanylate cyclase [Roseateles sp. DAIF2]QPF74397.1 diguanylate cyclase [Roseateles sp. DAIF2]